MGLGSGAMLIFRMADSGAASIPDTYLTLSAVLYQFHAHICRKMYDSNKNRIPNSHVSCCPIIKDHILDAAPWTEWSTDGLSSSQSVQSRDST